jgi:hypothetical protein
MPRGGRVSGSFQNGRAEQVIGAIGNIASNTGTLEYGRNNGHGGAHYVRFNARVQTGANSYLAGGAYNEEPNNSQQNLTVTRAPTRQTKGSVVLYLPAQISVSQKANFGEPEVGGLVAGGLAAVKNFTGANSESGKAAINAVKDQFGQNIGEAVARGLGNLGEGLGATGAASVTSIATGRTVNNNTELMFEGVDRRSFSFTFRLLPHDAAEAATIQEIVKSFRFHMMPHLPNAAQFGRTLVAPSTYNISYSHQAELHRISECILESVDVKYGGERPQFFHDNRPTETELTLQFKELEIMTKKRIEEGF